MDRMTKFKEAFKTGLAMVLVYGIALKVNWMNPYWAGWAVGMISLATAGESIHKGMLRLAGTIPACIAALVILSVAPQNRWLFLVLVCAWIFFTTYMMLFDKQHSYFWNVAGFVCLIILLAGPGSSDNLFMHAIYRTVETGMGVLIYMLVSVFLWPRTNLGAIRKTGSVLAATQGSLVQAAREIMTTGKTQINHSELHAQEVQQLARFAQMRLAEGSESYEIHEMRHEWDRLNGLFATVMESLDRWQTGLADLTGIDVNAVLPDLPAFFNELEARYTEIQGLLDGKSPIRRPGTITLNVDHDALKSVSNIDKAALAVTRQELENLGVLTLSMIDCARNLAGVPSLTKDEKPAAPIKPHAMALNLPVFDPDHLRGAAFASICVAVGFLVWIYINPPGHAGWFQFVGSIAMVVAGTQQLKASILAKPIGLASAVGLLAYVFIMPKLSTFVGLGTLIFISMFIVCYFFTGLPRLAGIIAVLNEISVSNPQTYNFAAMANSYVFTILAFFFIFAMSYMLRSPRPEKAVLSLVRRFYRSAAFIVSQLETDPGRSSTLMQRWRTAFHRQELKTIPAKIKVWGSTINPIKFPENKPEQLQGLVASLQTLAYRIEVLYDAGDIRQTASFRQALDEDIRTWHMGMTDTFKKWSCHPDIDVTDNLQDGLDKWLNSLEKRIETALEQTDTTKISPEDGQNFFRLLGGIRGVTAAAVGCASSSGTINWVHWREEMF